MRALSARAGGREDFDCSILAEMPFVAHLTESAGIVQGVLEYRRDILESDSVELLTALFTEILDAVVEFSDIRIGAIHERLRALKESHRRA